MIAHLLTIFFFILIINCIINYFTKPNIIEGATGGQVSTNSSDPLILANKNAADIDILKQKIDEISKIATEVSVNTSDIKKISEKTSDITKSIDPETTKANKLNEQLALDVSKNTADIKNISQTVDSLMQSMSPTDNKASQKNQKLVDEDPSTFNM